MDKVRVGVIGAGPWGNNLIRNVVENAQGELVSVCDSNATSLERIRWRYESVKTVGVLDELLAVDGLEAVMVATPARLHFEHARRALLAGKHVLVEKPLCTSSADALELCRMAEASGRVLMVGHTYIYNNLVYEVKRRIQAGELGQVRYLCSRRLNLGRVRTDVDALWNLAPHDLSIVCCLLEDWPVAVNANGWSYLQSDRDIADVCFYQMEFEGGIGASGHVSWLDPQKERTTVVVGSERMLVYDDMDASRHLQLFDKGVEVQFQEPLGAFSDFATRVRSGDLNIPNVRLVEPLAVEISHFLDCIRTGETPRSDGWAGMNVVSVLEAMSRSMADGGRRVLVDIPRRRTIELETPNPDALASTVRKALEKESSLPEKQRWAKSPSTILSPNTSR